METTTQTPEITITKDQLRWLIMMANRGQMSVREGDKLDAIARKLVEA